MKNNIIIFVVSIFTIGASLAFGLYYTEAISKRMNYKVLTIPGKVVRKYEINDRMIVDVERKEVPNDIVALEVENLQNYANITLGKEYSFIVFLYEHSVSYQVKSLIKIKDDFHEGDKP